MWPGAQTRLESSKGYPLHERLGNSPPTSNGDTKEFGEHELAQGGKNFPLTLGGPSCKLGLENLLCPCPETALTKVKLTL